MKARVGSAALVAVALAGVAHAAPSRWDRARDPSAQKIDTALRRAVRARTARDLLSEPIPGAEALLALRAATLLEMEGGEALASSEVWFFLGDAWVAADHGRDEDGIRVLERALAREPESPLAARAHFDVALAASRLFDLEKARDHASEALVREWDPEARARVHLLRAQVLAAEGEFALARSDYVRVLEEATDAEPRALAGWGMAVSFARDLDLPDALARVWEPSQARFADSQGNSITVLELPGVRLLRAHDVFYYRALAAMAAADHGELVAVRKMELEWAVSQWKRYVTEARLSFDPFADGASRLLRSCELRLADLAKKPPSGRLPGRKGPGASH